MYCIKHKSNTLLTMLKKSKTVSQNYILLVLLNLLVKENFHLINITKLYRF